VKETTKRKSLGRGGKYSSLRAHVEYHDAVTNEDLEQCFPNTRERVLALRAVGESILQEHGYSTDLWSIPEGTSDTLYNTLKNADEFGETAIAVKIIFHADNVLRWMEEGDAENAVFEALNLQFSVDEIAFSRCELDALIGRESKKHRFKLYTDEIKQRWLARACEIRKQEPQSSLRKIARMIGKETGCNDRSIRLFLGKKDLNSSK